MQRFRSGIDAWILGLIIASFVAQLVAVGVILAYEPPGRQKFLIVGLMIFVIVLMLWFLLRTYYVVGNGELRIVFGPFSFRIALDDIVSVEPSRALWSSPALSLDRLKISYGQGKWVLISPADKRGFLRALGKKGG